MATDNRVYTSRRLAIIRALRDKFREIDGSGNYRTNLRNNVEDNLNFMDESHNMPAVHVTAGRETRSYQGGGYKDRFLAVTIYIFVYTEDSRDQLEAIIEDIETVIENNTSLTYIDRDDSEQTTHTISIISINTDDGALNPWGIGEIECEVRY